MDEDVLTWVVMFLIVSALVSLVVILAALLPRVARTMRAAFYCPWAHQSVVVQYLTRDGSHPIGVLSCTAFADPIRVTCRMSCVAGTGRTGAPNQQDRPLDS